VPSPTKQHNTTVAPAPDTAKTRRDPGAPVEATAAEQDELVLEDLLVEDVSIDGMCGVY
jgi:mycofactocin precursor